MTNISDYLEKHAQDYPKKIFLKTEKDYFSFEEINNKVKKLSSKINQFPNKSIISIMFDNSVEFVISYLSILKSGRIVHIMSPSISKSNFLNQIASCSPEIILTLNKFKKQFEDENKSVNLIDFYEFEKETQSSQSYYVSDTASLLYTSGTTSSPKGVLIKNSNILFTTKNIIDILDYKNSDIDTLPLPLSHSFGLGCLHVSLYVGSTLILKKNSMNILNIFDSINENNATTFAAVPATLTSIVNNFPEEFSEKCKRLRLIVTNSTKIPKTTTEKILKLLPNVKLSTYYGLTEASRSTFMIFNENKNKFESVGKVAPNVKIKIVRDNNESKSGEIWIKGKNVITNYWNSKFSEKFSNDWLKTGDLGFFDLDGFLYLTGRLDDVINIGGEKVNPTEIENLVKKMEVIEEVIAVGVDHKLFGQAVKLLVKTSQNQKMQSLTIINHCKKNLERYKVPIEVEFVSNFPKNEYGKIIRRLITDNNNGNS